MEMSLPACAHAGRWDTVGRIIDRGRSFHLQFIPHSFFLTTFDLGTLPVLLDR